jgi:DNA-binding MarR family transcriptional regulator
MAELAESVTISRGGLTKLADRLEAAGLLHRDRVDADARGVCAVITIAGDDVPRRMWPVYAAVLQESFVAEVTPDEATAIADGLGRVARASWPSGREAGAAKA